MIIKPLWWNWQTQGTLRLFILSNVKYSRILMVQKLGKPLEPFIMVNKSRLEGILMLNDG